jgi:hypothetical protein
MPPTMLVREALTTFRKPYAEKEILFLDSASAVIDQIN